MNVRFTCQRMPCGGATYCSSLVEPEPYKCTTCIGLPVSNTHPQLVQGSCVVSKNAASSLSSYIYRE